MTLNDLLNKKFDRAAVGGYRADDVNSFVISVSDEFERLTRDRVELEEKLVLLADRLEEYRGDEESMRSALLGAQKLGDNIVKESQEKSELLIQEAKKEAERIVEASKAEAERINNDAKLKLESETYALNKMKREVSRFKKQMLALYKQHVSLIESMPSEGEHTNGIEDSLEDKAPKLSSPLTTKFSNSINNIHDIDKKGTDITEGFRLLEEE